MLNYNAAQPTPVDPLPDPTTDTQPQRINWEPIRPQVPSFLQPKKPSFRGCWIGFWILIGLSTIVITYSLFPGRVNILLLGIDTREPKSNLGRTDTIILTTFVPAKPYIGMLAIPRDLWVNIPGVGENRINTAHFFAEASKPGSGPQAAMETVRTNFGVNVDYFIRIHFDGLQEVVDTMGGVDINLSQAMSGLSAGIHHLNGTEALAFVRDRKGSDDLFRMERGQIFLKAVYRQILQPTTWVHLPAILVAIFQTVDTDIPAWQWPRLIISLLRTGPDGIDGRTITHEMVTPFTTSAGASVLAPNWELINPVLLEMFEQ